MRGLGDEGRGLERDESEGKRVEDGERTSFLHQPS